MNILMTIKHLGGDKPSLEEIREVIRKAKDYFGTFRGLLSISKSQLIEQMKKRGMTILFSKNLASISKKDINGKIVGNVEFKRKPGAGKDKIGNPVKTKREMKDGKPVIQTIKDEEKAKQLEERKRARIQLAEEEKAKRKKRSAVPKPKFGTKEAGVQTRQTIRPTRGRPRRDQGV